MLSESEYPLCVGHEKRRGQDLPVSTIIPQPLSDLPREQLGNAPSWFHVTGQLIGNQVIIRKSGDIALLLNMGVFGTRLHPRFKAGSTEAQPDDSSDACSDDEDEEIILPAKRRRIDDEEMDHLPPLISAPSVPITDTEPLILSSYEAFFLVHSVGMLQIHLSESSNSLSIQDLWNLFVKQCSVFPYHYAVYLYYRSKGWVPKHGLRVGADFTLYPIGPPYFHAAYSVRIHIVHSDVLSSSQAMGKSEDLPRMKNVMIDSRVTNKVNKKLIICYVIIPEFLTGTDSPKMVEQLKVKEILVERFHPEKQ